jgi:hypothetical protein
MQHRFEFVAKIKDGRIFHMFYVGESSRHKKVQNKILIDLEKVYNVDPVEIEELYLKPIKHNNGKPPKHLKSGIE